MENIINEFKVKYCTDYECLPLVGNIKTLLKNPESYKPLNFRLQQHEDNQITVTTMFQSTDGLHSGIGWVTMKGEVLYFSLE